MENKKFIIFLAKEIRSLGGTLYYVGGYVRDKFIFQNSLKKDIDLEVYDISFENTLAILKKSNSKFLLNEKFKTVKVKNIDITFPRKEVSTGTKHTDFSITIDPFISPKEASYRRDFTMNAIMENVLTGEVLDFHNGINDIKNKKINLISSEHFAEDPLRPLRAIEFSCRFGFDIDKKITDIGKNTNYRSISKERIKSLFDKILLSENVESGIEKLKYFNFFNQIFYDLDFNVIMWKNILKTVSIGSTIKNTALYPLYFMYACFFYNISNLDSIEKNLEHITNEKKLIYYLKELIEKYPFFKNINNTSDYNLKYNLIGTKNILDILKLCVVDEYVNPTEFNYSNAINIINKNSNNGFGNIVPLVKGVDLINLGIKNRKLYSSILNYALDFQLKGYSKKYILKLIKLNFRDK